MKKNLLFLAFALFALSASAQQNPAVGAQQATTAAQPVLRFGYFSFEHNMDELRGKYDEETKRVETEFNSKYEEFLDGQRSYAKSIFEKRQAELRELMEKNIAFKAEAARLLKKAEEEAYAPLKAKMNAALQQIGKENGFAFILNTDNNATPYLSAEMGVDITEALKEKIK